MVRAAMFAVLGYLSGSVLYARVFARLFRKENMLEQSRDQNPGTANAFLYGGFLTVHQCIKLAKTGLVLYKTPKMSCGGLCPLYNRERVGYNPIRYHCIALPQ